MMDFGSHKKKMLAKDPALFDEYKALEPEYEIVRELIAARSEQGLTQKELAQITGIPQAHISRLENASYNPSLTYLKRIAAGLGKELHISFS